MIQRIQSFLLALVVFINAGVFFTPLYNHAANDPAQWILIIFSAALGLSALLSVVSIFMYQNRPNQRRWVKIAMLFQVVALGFGTGILFSLGGFGTYLWDETLSLGLVLIGLILQIVANKYIKKDEELVRSMDRIR